MSTPKALSKGEAAFALHCRAEGLKPIPEYRLDVERKWRFDFAFPDEMIAVEIEGGIWSGGRHTRGKGFELDCAKYNYAAKLGWRVLRYSTGMVTAGTAINDVLEALK